MTKVDTRRWQSVDHELLRLGSEIKVLSRLSWPSRVHDDFLTAWRSGKPRLPEPTYEHEPMHGQVEAFRELQRQLDTGHPVERYLNDTIQSYIALCRLLENAGSPRMTPYSIELYGRPGDSLAGGTVNNIQAAEHFLEVAHYFRSECVGQPQRPLSAVELQTELEIRLQEVFVEQEVRIVVDDSLVSKAAAGASRIRLRGGTSFTEHDREQLLQHEAFVHSLTALNGRKQQRLTTLGLGAPRTTATQEGLATFAELITGAIDIDRLERIALRILAIENALSGADFIDVFRFFLDAGQSETEGFFSTMRVFRGAPLTGGSAFTKDTVYLHGLMEVHTFFRWCMQHQRLELIRSLFAGRMTISDVIRLAPLFEDGTLDAPVYLPPWVGQTNVLSAYLAFSVFASRIRIEGLDGGYAFDEIEQMGI